MTNFDTYNGSTFQINLKLHSRLMYRIVLIPLGHDCPNYVYKMFSNDNNVLLNRVCLFHETCNIP